jgi:hypothetical protein
VEKIVFEFGAKITNLLKKEKRRKRLYLNLAPKLRKPLPRKRREKLLKANLHIQQKGSVQFEILILAKKHSKHESATTLSIMSFNIMTFDITTFGVMIAAAKTITTPATAIATAIATAMALTAKATVTATATTWCV